jgi:hypothetical protein
MTDDKVLEFPKSAAERQALAKARQDRERRRLVNAFIDESGQGLFNTPDGVAYADLIIEGCRQTWAVRSKQFRFAYCKYLQREIDRLTDAGSVAALMLKASLNRRRINETIEDFEMRALTSETEREVHLRVASHSGDLYVDLCDRDWHVIRITGAGWQVVQSPPVRFRRSPGMLPLPFPERGTPIGALRPFLNVTDVDFTLVVAFILAALRDRGPYPILVLNGEQGTAKSTAARIVRGLTDPSSVPLSTLPPSSRDLFVAANNSRVLSFENISKLSSGLSDNLCRLATGGGYRIRTNYENTTETLFAATRPIILNGIANFIVRGDLQDRSIVLSLAPIANRVTESELYADFEQRRAGIFGALLDLIVQGVAMLPGTRLREWQTSRFGRWRVGSTVLRRLIRPIIRPPSRPCWSMMPWRRHCGRRCETSGSARQRNCWIYSAPPQGSRIARPSRRRWRGSRRCYAQLASASRTSGRANGALSGSRDDDARDAQFRTPASRSS